MFPETRTSHFPADPDRSIAALRRAVSGAIVTPADADWDSARQAWALSADQRPALVALPESAADVAAVVGYARRQGLRVAAQGTGHAAQTLAAHLAETILLKTSQMRGVRIDADRRIARAEAGALWADVTDAAAPHGLAALAGSSRDVGVVGYTLGGGVSFLARRHGLAANRVTAIELVTADGELIRADSEHDPDLFWAMRGGGGSFGVVTAIEFELLAIREVYAGVAFFPQTRAREVLHAWRELTQSGVPDDLTTIGRLMNFPPFPEVPEQLRGRSFVLVEAIYLGDAAEGERLVAPIRALEPEFDTFGTIPAQALGHLHMDPEGPVPARGDGMMLAEAPEEAIDALVDAAGPDSQSMLISAELRHIGGALARPAAGHGALASFDAQYLMFAVGPAPVPEVTRIVEAQVTRVKDALAPWGARQTYLNFAEREVEADRFYATEYTYRRLQAVKAAYDPGEVFQSNHPIRPPR